MTFLQCHSDFEEHNQVLGRVNNNSKLIPEALGVPDRVTPQLGWVEVKDVPARGWLMIMSMY